MLKPSPLVALLAIAAMAHARPQLVFTTQPLQFIAQPGAASFHGVPSHVFLLPPRRDEGVGEASEPPLAPATPGYWGQFIGFFRPPPAAPPVVAPAEPQKPAGFPAEKPPSAVLPAELPPPAVLPAELPATQESRDKAAADREPLEEPDLGPPLEPEVTESNDVERPDAARRQFPAQSQFFGSYDFLRRSLARGDALLLLGSPEQGGSPWSDPRHVVPSHVVPSHVVPSHVVPSHVVPSHVVSLRPGFQTVYLVRGERDSVAISAPTTQLPSSTTSPAVSTEQAGPSVAQAKPQAIAVAGVGGVASASPVATALVGPGGLAVAAPSATAVAGQTQGQLVAPALAAVQKLRAPISIARRGDESADEYAF